MTTNYARGRAFEYKVRDHCMSKEVGATYVMRAAGSHTLADLAVFFMAGTHDHAVGHEERGVALTLVPRVWLVQCKRDGRLSAEERELLISLANEVGANAILASAGPRGTPVVLESFNE